MRPWQSLNVTASPLTHVRRILVWCASVGDAAPAALAVAVFFALVVQPNLGEAAVPPANLAPARAAIAIAFDAHLVETAASARAALIVSGATLAKAQPPATCDTSAVFVLANTARGAAVARGAAFITVPKGRDSRVARANTSLTNGKVVAWRSAQQTSSSVSMA